MDCIVLEVTKSQTQLSDFYFTSLQVTEPFQNNFFLGIIVFMFSLSSSIEKWGFVISFLCNKIFQQYYCLYRHL